MIKNLSVALAWPTNFSAQCSDWPYWTITARVNNNFPKLEPNRKVYIIEWLPMPLTLTYREISIVIFADRANIGNDLLFACGWAKPILTRCQKDMKTILTPKRHTTTTTTTTMKNKYWNEGTARTHTHTECGVATPKGLWHGANRVERFKFIIIGMP